MAIARKASTHARRKKRRVQTNFRYPIMWLPQTVPALICPKTNAEQPETKTENKLIASNIPYIVQTQRIRYVINVSVCYVCTRVFTVVYMLCFVCINVQFE